MEMRKYDLNDFSQLVIMMTSLQAYFVEIDQTKEKRLLETPAEAEAYIQQTLKDVAEMDGVTFVAEEDRKVVGFIQGVIKNNENEVLYSLTHQKSLDGWIGLFFIDPSFRSKGIGLALLDTIKAYFKEKNCTTMRLFVASNNQRGIDIYTKFGFKPTELEMSAKL